MRVLFQSPAASNGTPDPSLSEGTVYEVLGIEADWYRLLSDRGEPVLFDPRWFQVIDPTDPGNWVSVVEDGVRYAYPPGWGRPGFFEDWHDGVPEVRSQFRHQLATWHPAVTSECKAG
jgi:hypothetical protein